MAPVLQSKGDRPLKMEFEDQLKALIFYLCGEASRVLPDRYRHPENLTAIDGSLIDAVLFMTWADYRKHSKKAKAHLGFDINKGIPAKFYLTDGKGGERPFFSQFIDPGQTRSRVANTNPERTA